MVSFSWKKRQIAVSGSSEFPNGISLISQYFHLFVLFIHFAKRKRKLYLKFCREFLRFDFSRGNIAWQIAQSPVNLLVFQHDKSGELPKTHLERVLASGKLALSTLFDIICCLSSRSTRISGGFYLSFLKKTTRNWKVGFPLFDYTGC